ncbi:MAG: hypothetical protein J4224_01395 [Candidatus Diapherotrites archaeon]|uniref:50S ribosomal protein L1 n=3 Tax=Candidatus Iainarchaeum sp. TaxID=3101447 RepID=A0A8T4L0Q4_9ARCH|nr:MAG: large subunit ribosomal protein L1 [archaeon GW2011_AR10]MBS3059059.1 hypothetical protein [Candidatus Diapherotrites archaeon]
MKDQEVLEALQRMRDASKKRNFVQSIDLTINFKGIDFKKAENRVDVEVTMPNPTGKHSEVKTLVFVKDKDFASQLKGKASKIIMDEQIPSLKKKDVEELVSNYNVLLAEGQAILAVGKYLGQQLAPRGKMPKPIQPSINSFEEMISKSSTSLNVSNKKGKFMPLVHVTVGREKDEDRKVADNVIAVFNAVVQGLEKREQNIKSVYLKLSMGPPIKIGAKEGIMVSHKTKPEGTEKIFHKAKPEGAEKSSRLVSQKTKAEKPLKSHEKKQGPAGKPVKQKTVAAASEDDAE